MHDLGVPDKRGDRKVREEGGRWLRMGVGNSGEQVGKPGERGCLGDPRGGTGVASGLSLGEQRVTPELWGEGSEPSEERAGGQS